MSRLEWLTAWRHLRALRPPPWLGRVSLMAAYLVVVGLGFLIWSASAPRPGLFGPAMFEAPPVDHAGFFGVFTLAIGGVVLAFCGLARLFNLLATIITFSVAQGCMALVLVLGLMSGLEDDLRGRLLDHKAHIRVAQHDGAGFVADDALMTALTNAPEVAGASAVLEGEVLVRTAYGRQGATLLGVDPERHRGVTALAREVEQGSYAFMMAPERIPTLGTMGFEEERAGAPEPTPVPEPASDEDEGWEDPAAAALAAPPAPPVPKDLPEEPDDGGDWEDPEVEIPRLRASGALPPAVAPAMPPELPAGTPVAPDAVPESPEPPPEAAPTPPEAYAVLPPVLIGRELAADLGVGLGDRLQLITPVGRITPQGMVPGMLVVRVAGVFFTGIFDFDRKHVYLPLPQTQAFQRAGTQVTAIEVKLREVAEIDAGKAAVTAAVAGTGLVVEDWRDQNRDLFSAMFLEKVAMSIALVFVILVAAFGILATNLMSVLEKAPEIAILKTMGCRDEQVARIFALEGLCVGVLGMLGGIATGVGVGLALGVHGLPLQGGVFYLES
ncbi:MAG TPA: FtsX-like permease family protein, partial [Nannocystis sp.]